MTQNFDSYVFNFSASYFGGGLKRITAYLKWFNQHGGANFVLNEKLIGIEKSFPENRYCFLKQRPIDKVLNYSPTLNQFLVQIPKIDLYYSYGIPLPRKIGKVNWIHVANVLPFVNARKYVLFRRSLEMRLLGILMNNSMKYADVISAESDASLQLIKKNKKAQRFISVNGSDDEITAYQNQINVSDEKFENIAVAVGTCKYKSIDDVYKIYCYLRQSNPTLELHIAGIKEDVPVYVQQDKQVILQGVLPQLAVCELLKKAKYYITATQIENSYNAAAEGIYLARESFVSDIGPHRELLKDVKFQVIRDFDIQVPSLYVKQKDVDIRHLKSWDQVVNEMIYLLQPNHADNLDLITSAAREVVS
jgi:glycosyltransferase involved in cell wall biosynthesis